MTHDEMIAVIQAHREGRAIEYRESPGVAWSDSASPNWAFNYFDRKSMASILYIVRLHGYLSPLHRSLAGWDGGTIR